MLSRTADAVYWMNRYIERAANLARLLDVNFTLMLDFPAKIKPWGPLVNTTGDRALFQERFGEPTPDKVLAFLALDMENPNSIYSCLHAARENARSVREIISSEMWEEINKFYLMVRTSASAGQIMDSPHEFFTAVRMANHLYRGITYDTMSRGEAWHFGRLGCLLERADKTSRILDAQYLLLPSSHDYTRSSVGEIQWSAVLKSVGAFEMYRQRHGRITPVSVAAFLLLDREFPRAMHSCIIRAEESMCAIAGPPRRENPCAAEVLLGSLNAELDNVDIDDTIDNLHAFSDAFQAKLNNISDAINETYFALPPIS